jgi:ATP-dependent protease HslVU (ClpYQ) peptidase subunit
MTGPYVMNKVGHGPGMLFGCAGSALLQTLILECVQDISSPEAAISNIVQMLRDRGSRESIGDTLVLTHDGILEINGDSCILPLDSEYWAVGSGFPFAVGWLAGIRSKRKLTPKDGVNAIQFAATLTMDVGRECQVEYLG